MSDIITYPENGITYDADDASGYLATRLSGVYSAEDDFAVSISGELSLTVSAGQAWVRPSRFKGRSIIMEQPTTLTLTAADPVRTRIDRVVLRYDAAARQTRLQVLEGTPDSASLTAPAITRTALVYDLCLAEITRPAGSTAITAADLTDTRADEDICGIMRDGVTGIPTAQLIAQWRAAQAELETQLRAQLAVLNAEIKEGSAYSKAEADAKFALTADKISTALGYDPGDKITRLERMMNMDGKLVYSSKMYARNTEKFDAKDVTVTCVIPNADYAEVAAIKRYTTYSYSSSYGGGVAAAPDYGTYRVARGGTVRAKVTDDVLADVAFSSGGILSVTVLKLAGTNDANRGINAVDFNVFGYKYPA